MPQPVDISGKAWAAMRFRTTDPGPVIMHCHIDAHLATGMVVGTHISPLGFPSKNDELMVHLVLLEGPEKLVPGYVPSYYLNKSKP